MEIKPLEVNLDKILHIMPDDKFNDRAVVRFEEVAPGMSGYLVPATSTRPFEYITSSLIKPMSYAGITSLFDEGRAKVVFFHSLPTRHRHLVRAVPKTTKIVWIGWGNDYYKTLLRSQFPYPAGLLDPHTIQHFLPNYSKKLPPLRRLKDLLRFALKSQPSAFSKKDFKRIDYFIPVLKKEYDISRETNPWFTAEYAQWLYSRKQDERQYETCVSPNAENVMLGNSASLTNNHLDALRILAEGDKKSFTKLFCPLSYGDKKVALSVTDLGKYYFGKKFVPLHEFLSKDSYHAIMRTCHTVVMNHVRQQAGGNINFALNTGVRVVLNPRSVFRGELNSRGLYFDVLGMHRLDFLPSAHRLHNIKSEAERRAKLANPDILSNLLNKLL